MPLFGVMAAVVVVVRLLSLSRSVAKGVNVRATEHTAKCGSPTEKCVFFLFFLAFVLARLQRTAERKC